LPSVAITNFDESTFILDVVEENGPSFIDSAHWRTVDVPVELSGAMQLRSIAMFDKPGIKFSVESPIKV